MTEKRTCAQTMNCANPTPGDPGLSKISPSPRAMGRRIIGGPAPAFLAGLALFIAIPMGILGLAQPAHARQAAAEAEARQTTFLTVTGEQPVPLRCGSQDIWYAIVEVPPGTVLAGDQQIGSGWWSIAYPHGVPVVVPIEEGRLVQPGGPVEIIEPSTLKAFNMLEPVREESFRRVLADQLEPGTRLRYIRSINARDGSVGGYLVHPPAAARLWIDGRNVREATAAEIQAFRAAEEARKEREQPERPAPTSEPEPQPEPAPQTTETPADPEPETPTTGDTTDAGAAEPATTDDAPDQAAEPSDTDEQGDPVPPARRAAERVAALDATLEATIRSPLESAEFDALMAQYGDIATGLNAESDPDGMLAAAIEERINLLTLRSELQAARRELIAIREGQTAADVQVRGLLERARATRQYAVVGRLSTSTVFDGVSLPRLLRIVSIEGQRGRTLAYLALQEDQDFDALLGQIVGVAAPPATESTNRVPILVPSTVDPLDAAAR